MKTCKLCKRIMMLLIISLGVMSWIQGSPGSGISDAIDNPPHLHEAWCWGRFRWHE